MYSLSIFSRSSCPGRGKYTCSADRLNTASSNNSGWLVAKIHIILSELVPVRDKNVSRSRIVLASDIDRFLKKASASSIKRIQPFSVLSAQSKSL